MEHPAGRSCHIKSLPNITSELQYTARMPCSSWRLNRWESGRLHCSLYAGPRESNGVQGEVSTSIHSRSRPMTCQGQQQAKGVHAPPPQHGARLQKINQDKSRAIKRRHVPNTSNHQFKDQIVLISSDGCMHKGRLSCSHAAYLLH